MPSSVIGIALMMRRPIDLPLWLKHHRQMGVKKFYIRLEDSPGLEDYLSTQPDIYFEVKTSDKSNNYETIQVRQIEFANRMLVKAREENVGWLFHIDVDELLEGSLDFLDNLPNNVTTIKIQNAEAIYDEDEPTCFSASKFIKCSEIGAQCRAYVNGKGAGRVVDNVTLAGPHDFAFYGKIEPFNVPFEQLHVLHFDSCTFASWTDKFKHLGKNKKGDIPFGYYNESIKASSDAFDVYKKFVMQKIENDTVYNRDEEGYKLV